MRDRARRMKPLVLVDGMGYLFRAFYALPPLTTSGGEPTGAVRGVLSMLYKLLDEYEPERVAVVFDAPGKTFRDDLYSDYKANRPPFPPDLRAQIEPLLEAVDSMGLAVLRIEGVEADDVIGTLAEKAGRAGLTTVISTSDKDMAQLVDERTSLINTMTGVAMNPAGVREKFGVAPEQIVDYLALVGDTVDNIPGVPKVGPKTAAKWLGNYGDLDTLVARADEVGGAVGNRLRENLDVLPLYKKLVTIVRDVELPLTLDELKPRTPDADRLRALFERLELRSLLRHIEEDQPGTQDEDSAVSYTTVLTEAEFEDWVARVEAADLVALDTETTSLDYMKAEIVGICLSVEPLNACYIPVAHRYPGAPEQLSREYVLERLKPWLESDARKVGHHLKYDAHVLKNYGIELRGMAFDSMLESFVLNSTATRHDMDSVAARYLNVQTTKYEEIAGKGAKQIGFDEVDLDTAGAYAAQDADITLRLHRTLWPKLQEIPDLARLYTDVEQPLVPVLQKMEYLGVLVDRDMLRRQSRELAGEIGKIVTAAHEMVDVPFNLDSPKQLQDILFNRLDIESTVKTPKGQPSTAERVLQELARDGHEMPKLILEYRGLSKLKSTYTDKLPLEINPRTGRIHTSYHQAVAATGRLSSADPNLQNIPVRTPEGRRIRQAFVAPEGYRLVAADYSQIELRIMAHLSGDEGLLGSFARDEDIHSATAAEVFEVARDDVSADQRRAAKAINFGLIYGMSAFGLARQLKIGRGAAQQYVDLYFARYPDVKAYMDETRQRAREEGFVSTVFGRRLYLPEINSRNFQRRQYAERSAINAPMQGTAADIIKRAMIMVDRWIDESGADARLIMQVHDELVLEVAENAAEDMAVEVERIMKSAASLKVPLKVDWDLGSNWDEAH